ncbi:hypothetical protein CPB84DRAFT_1785949, partial [Gymnopilus junonius]
WGFQESYLNYSTRSGHGANVEGLNPVTSVFAANPHRPSPTRTCYESARAHWFIFIPSPAIPNIGKVIQVVGNTDRNARLYEEASDSISSDCLGETVMRSYHRSEIPFGRSQFRNSSTVKSGIES